MGNGVGDDVGVGLRVGVGDGIGADVGVEDGTGTGVGVGLRVGVGDGIGADVGVEDGTGTGVGVEGGVGVRSGMAGGSVGARVGPAVSGGGVLSWLHPAKASPKTRTGAKAFQAASAMGQAYGCAIRILGQSTSAVGGTLRSSNAS